jgi:hypothetical protein
MMRRDLICLTIDTDPDNLSGKTINRRSLEWDGLLYGMREFHAALPEIPLTWYVRADGQLEDAYGSVLYLFEQYRDFWEQALARGDELGWHPHLYRQPTPDAEPIFLTDEAQAVEELTRLWQQVQHTGFDLPTFRMGEAWHTPHTLDLLESLGFQVDSTCIPDRDDSASGHPRNWAGAPNQPYYPDRTDIRRAGAVRNLLEIPITSWRFQASYDNAPKLRYMNPCVHRELWEQALDRWQEQQPVSSPLIWTLILHPGEALPREQPDMLYAYSLETVRHNLKMLEERIHRVGGVPEYTTVFRAASVWKASF